MDIVIFTIKRFVEVIFLIVFWGAVSNGSNLDLKTLTSYFLISGGVAELIMINNLPVGDGIKGNVRTGQLSNDIIKPISIFLAQYAAKLGSRVLIPVTSIIMIIVGIILIGNITLFGYLYFFIALIIAMFLSYSFNLLLGCLYLITTSTYSGITSIINQSIKFFSGALVPIYFFPDGLRQIIEFLPFNFMIYAPTTALLEKSLNNVIVKNVCISLVWSLVLLVISIYLWKKSLKKYEAYGI
ncbi:MAG: ABC-2 family transporter protein [bacterium]